MQQVEFRAMSCGMLVAIDSDAPEAQAWLAEAPRWLTKWEAHLSRFQPQSELMLLNGSAGRWVAVSPVLWAVIQAALEAASASAGLVTPTVLDAVEAAGYDRDFADGAWADEVRPTKAHPAPDPGALARIELDERKRSLRLPPGVRLDLGGIAKGWAADEIARRLGAVAPTLVDAGGDIAVSGPMANGSPWAVAVADPLRPTERLDLLLLTSGGVATSGREHRRWRQSEGYAHHIIDPRTGAPATTDVLSATVVAPSAVLAETCAKAALITGSAGWLAALERAPETTGLLMLDDAMVLRAPGWAERCWKESHP